MPVDPSESNAILEGLSTGVLLLTPDFRIAHLNPAAEDLLGLSLNQARSRSLAEVFPDAGELIDLAQRARENGGPYVASEITLITALDGRESITVDCRVTAMGEDPGRTQMLVELLDARGRLRISREAALLTQHDGSRTMIRQLAHEIKNPLGGLRGAAQLLERELPDAELRDYTRIIVSEADRLAALVDRMLGPVQPPAKEEVNIHELLQHVRQLIVNEAPADVVVERDYDPSLPKVWVDRDQMIQAMLNLARNAVQAVSPSGQVWLRTRAVSNATIAEKRHRLAAIVEFEDDGPGVAEGLRDTLFYPLVSGRVGGTGLGLAMAQELVSRHEGLIEFTSRPGRTVFRLLLPLSEAR